MTVLTARVLVDLTNQRSAANPTARVLHLVRVLHRGCATRCDGGDVIPLVERVRDCGEPTPLKIVPTKRELKS
jgi:hypothetical protein